MIHLPRIQRVSERRNTKKANLSMLCSCCNLIIIVIIIIIIIIIIIVVVVVVVVERNQTLEMEIRKVQKR